MGPASCSRKSVSSEIQFDFEITLLMPGAQPVRFRLQARPPRDFLADGLGPDVYSAMAQHAFDELRRRLGTVFFRADSKAFQVLEQRTPW